MTDRQAVQVLNVPREIGNDDYVVVTQWYIEDGGAVSAGDAVVMLETSKMTFDLETARDGYLFHLAAEGEEAAIGTPIAVIADSAAKPDLRSFRTDVSHPSAAAPSPSGESPIITQKAAEMMQLHQIKPDAFPEQKVIRAKDVEALLKKAKNNDAPEGEPLTLSNAASTGMVGVVGDLRRAMQRNFKRHVPIGDLFSDRYQLASSLGFGAGSSVYDDCLVLGEPQVGKQCWIGPFTVLDGYHAPLVIGDYTSVGAGSQLYTHNTIEMNMSGYKLPMVTKETIIGTCCFISPNVVIAPGTHIGDHCFIAAGSYVEGSFEAYSYIQGNPAVKVGEVVVDEKRVRLKKFK